MQWRIEMWGAEQASAPEIDLFSDHKNSGNVPGTLFVSDRPIILRSMYIFFRYCTPYMASAAGWTETRALDHFKNM